MLLATTTSAFAQSGALVVVGGGGTGPEIVAKALAARRRQRRSSRCCRSRPREPDAGDASVKMWLRRRRARSAQVVVRGRRCAAALRARDAHLDARRRSEPLHEGDRGHRPRRGHPRAAIAPASRSAAPAPAPRCSPRRCSRATRTCKSLTAGATVIGKGLGLWPDALIDQHFLKRQRDNRLISAVLDHPVAGRRRHRRSHRRRRPRRHRFDVIGKSSVVVIDARRAQVDSARGRLARAAESEAVVLHAGQCYSLK